MATETTTQRNSVSDSDSTDTKSKNKFHIPVMDFEDYKLSQQQQQINDDEHLHSTRDDMFLHHHDRTFYYSSLQTQHNVPNYRKTASIQSKEASLKTAYSETKSINEHSITNSLRYE